MPGQKQRTKNDSRFPERERIEQEKGGACGCLVTHSPWFLPMDTRVINCSKTQEAFSIVNVGEGVEGNALDHTERLSFFVVVRLGLTLRGLRISSPLYKRGMSSGEK